MKLLQSTFSPRHGYDFAAALWQQSLQPADHATELDEEHGVHKECEVARGQAVPQRIYELREHEFLKTSAPLAGQPLIDVPAQEIPGCLVPEYRDHTGALSCE
eukprot:CAMPEP_0202342696 /NCGR_PEP_ID=MMETSP1126-20121109/3153_1 /ASSEMBLY_ACC=CAM_ASM_000457 /TAXON_ID=3047 /ORGANISM="Dunaliella tertiolecta, Strain CCMP1320" /LENGTH=102 /DNA_ID=CAMNT_0048933695 /DNA_START=337 /DNA_END=644 /DNA_ORIENTATION=+